MMNYFLASFSYLSCTKAILEVHNQSFLRPPDSCFHNEIILMSVTLPALSLLLFYNFNNSRVTSTQRSEQNSRNTNSVLV